jgi:hypothetical protein
VINLRKTLSLSNELLKKSNVDHALIGGFALAVYGQQRATSDIDFLADGSKKEIIKSAFSSAGFNLVFESPEELQFSGIGFVDILLANRPMSLEMIKRSKQNTDLGVYVLQPEDIIGLKIQAYKNDASRERQDKADIQKLLGLPGIDLTLIRKYADLFQEADVIEDLRKIYK